MKRGKTTEQFITEAKEIHGDKYDYSKVEYKNNYSKVCIICPEHGEFWTRPHEHLRGYGCRLCTYDRRRLDNFIEQAKKVHNDRYDYSKVEYKNYHAKIIIICPEHGEFKQSPAKHLIGQGCPKCKTRKKELNITIRETSNHQLTQEEFLQRLKCAHGNKYDYSKVEYINFYTKVCIICPEHSEFWSTPKALLSGQGCPNCQNRYISTEQFIERARQTHGDRYDYSKVKYINNHTKVCIICPEHGEFWQKPNIHWNGSICPQCAAKLNKMETKLFETISIAFPQGGFIQHYRNSEILDKQEIDIYSPIWKIGIEYQGEQHFKAIPFFGGEKRFEKQLARDTDKIEKCNNYGIKLLHFSYDSKIDTSSVPYNLYCSEEELISAINQLIID